MVRGLRVGLRLVARRPVGRVARSAACALAASVALFSWLAWGYVAANGVGKEIFRGQAGAFEIVVRVQPARPEMGRVHLTITPLDPESTAVLLNVEVEVVALNPEGEPTYRVRAVNAPLAVEYYDANITFESAGSWTLLVNVAREGRGRATFSVPLIVEEASLSPTLGGTLVWLAVLAALAGGGTYVWYSSRKLRASR